MSAITASKMSSDEIKLSPMLTMDPAQEKFVGEHADQGNPLLKRQYRDGYVVPELV